MNSAEALAFENHPDFLALIEMRKWDDNAKDTSIPIHENTFYENLCRTLLQSSAWIFDFQYIYT